MNSIHDPRPAGDFDLLTPDTVLQAVEGAYGLRLDGNIIQYNSYINRVYEIHSDSGQEYMAKFYRPGRWSEAAIIEEHSFIQDCVDLDIPTVAPLPDVDGDTLAGVEVVGPDPTKVDPAGAYDPRGPAEQAEVESEPAGSSSANPQEYFFALFPKRGGRNFDAESEQDWLRLGALVGRMHMAARKSTADHRQYCLPGPIIEQCMHELGQGDAVHPEHREEFFGLAAEIRRRIEPLFKDIPIQRVHGDCHRGNILERPGEGLLLIDFDDMMIGPAIQDLWLLLPSRADECPQEFNLIVEGYEQFLPFDYTQKRLIEPLRAMRMLYYLAWSARQRNDRRFMTEHPHWGTSAFWTKEIEDLRDQMLYCGE